MNIIAIANTDSIVSLVGKQGTTWELFLNLKNPDNTPMNITGFTFSGQMRTSYTATEKIDFTCSIISALEGKILIAASHTVTTAIVAYKENINLEKLNSYKGAGVYVYDIEMVDNTSKVSRILEGMLFVDPEVTR